MVPQLLESVGVATPVSACAITPEMEVRSRPLLSFKKLKNLKFQCFGSSESGQPGC